MTRTIGSGRSERGWGRLILGIFLVGIVAASPAVTAGELFVSSRADCLSPGFEELACGGAGTFFVGTGNLCGSAKVDSAGGGLYVKTEVGLSAGEAWTPCSEDRCFNDAPRDPWVAVVDWDDGHGRSVGETIRQASGYAVETRLFPLDAPGVGALESLPGVSDAHVLAQLCHVAREAAVDPPLAVNMSFGRLDAAPCREGSRALSCTIGEVIAHLREDLRIPIFAAAGHERQLLFPASDPGVLAIGSVDLAHLAATGKARPLPQTPPGVFGLFAGHGLYLEEPEGPGVWPVPPGSSYASALATGWWAAYRTNEPKLADKLLGLCGGALAPTIEGGAIRLACGSMALPGSALVGPSALLATALGERPEVCGGAVPHDGLVLEVEGPAEAPVRLTLAEVQASLSRPAPESRPCVPCHGSGGGGESTTGTDPMGDGLGAGSPPDVKTDPVEITVDLSESAGIPRELELLGLYLEVGNRTFRFSDSENVTFLGELTLGRVERLTLEGVPRPSDEALAFVYELRLREGGQVFRSSTPIFVHEHREEP